MDGHFTACGVHVLQFSLFCSSHNAITSYIISVQLQIFFTSKHTEDCLEICPEVIMMDRLVPSCIVTIYIVRRYGVTAPCYSFRAKMMRLAYVLLSFVVRKMQKTDMKSVMSCSWALTFLYRFQTCFVRSFALNLESNFPRLLPL